MRMRKTRRKVIASAATGLIGFAATSGVVIGSKREDAKDILRKRYPAWKKGYEKLVEKFGEQEATVVADISWNAIQKYENGAFSHEQALHQIKTGIYNHDELVKAKEDLRAHQRYIESIDQTVQTQVSQDRTIVSPDSYDGPYYVSFYEEETSESSALTGSSDTRTQLHGSFENTARARGYCGAVGAGTSTYNVRLYNEDISNGDPGDTIQVNIDYKAKGTTTSTVGSASTELYLFIRDDSGNIVREKIHDLGWSNGNYSRSAQFTLPSDTWDLGIELNGSASSIVEYTYSDYLSRGVDFKDRKVVIEKGDVDYSIIS